METIEKKQYDIKSILKKAKANSYTFFNLHNKQRNYFRNLYSKAKDKAIKFDVVLSYTKPSAKNGTYEEKIELINFILKNNCN